MPGKILIISNGALCRNPRVVKEASALAAAGYAVTVLTVRNHAPSEAADREILRTAGFQRRTVDMLPGETNATRVWLRRFRLWLARRAARHCRIRSMESLGPARALLAEARRTTADLTIVHNEVPHWVGTQLLAEGRRVAVDFEDWHSEDLLPEDRTSRPLERLREIERVLLSKAAYVSTTSLALARGLQLRYGSDLPVVISNSFPLQPDPRVASTTAAPAFFWFSQTLGPGRGLELFLAAWAKTSRPSRVVLLGEDRGRFSERLLALLPETHRGRVSFLALVPPSELPSVIARHDIGLALEQPFIVNRDLTITNKILQYLNAGLAVVASNTAGQREVLAHDPAVGVLVNLSETTEFAAELDALLSDRAALAARQQAARQLAEKTYCWEQEAPRLVATVQAALAQPA